MSQLNISRMEQRLSFLTFNSLSSCNSIFDEWDDYLPYLAFLLITLDPKAVQVFLISNPKAPPSITLQSALYKTLFFSYIQTP